MCGTYYLYYLFFLPQCVFLRIITPSTTNLINLVASLLKSVCNLNTPDQTPGKIVFWGDVITVQNQIQIQCRRDDVFPLRSTRGFGWNFLSVGIPGLWLAETPCPSYSVDRAWRNRLRRLQTAKSFNIIERGYTTNTNWWVQQVRLWRFNVVFFFVWFLNVVFCCVYRDWAQIKICASVRSSADGALSASGSQERKAGILNTVYNVSLFYRPLLCGWWVLHCFHSEPYFMFCFLILWYDVLS